MPKGRIYDITMDRQVHPGMGLVMFGTGVFLAIRYLLSIKSTILADIANFPDSFHSDAALTIAFAALKLVAYVAAGILAGVMVYWPVRDLWLRRVVFGKLNSVALIENGKTKSKVLIKLGGQSLRISNADVLSTVLTQESLIQRELCVTIGAFDRVLAVDVIN